VLTTPLIQVLAREVAVDVLTTPAAAKLLEGHPAVRRVIAFDKRGSDGGPLGLWRMAQRVRAESPQSVAYCAQGSLRTVLLAILAGYRNRVGFETSDGRPFYTRRIPYRVTQHHAERLLRLAVGDDAIIESDELSPSLYPTDADREAVDALLAQREITGERLIALAPGSIWGTKRWPGFPALARSLAAHGRIVVIGGEADRELAVPIVSAAPGAIDATGQLGLLASAELIRRTVLLVTNDSLPQHLASAMGTPTVTIFGPTIEGFGFGPLAPGSSAIGHEGLDCRPCHPHGPAKCPLGHHRCMRDLAESSVLARAISTIAA
jgi:heptosyltransferase-2